MKKKMVTMISLLSFFVFTGCSTKVPTVETTDTTTTVDTSETTIDSGATSSEETSIEDTSESSKEEDTTIGTVNNGILFVPQKSDIEQGFTIENDDALQKMEKLVRESDPAQLGIERDVAIQFTGLYLEGEEKTNAIFVIVNKTDMAMTNMEFKLSLQTADGTSLLDQYAIKLTEDVFGILEPNTAMPLYVDIDPSKKELLYKLVEERQEKISLDDFKYEEINSGS